jgi:hypothetical protein
VQRDKRKERRQKPTPVRSVAEGDSGLTLCGSLSNEIRFVSFGVPGREPENTGGRSCSGAMVLSLANGGRATPLGAERQLATGLLSRVCSNRTPAPPPHLLANETAFVTCFWLSGEA